MPLFALAVWTTLSTSPLDPLLPVPAACQGVSHPVRTLERRRLHVPWIGPASAQDVPYAPFGPRNVFDWYAPPASVAGQSAAPVIVYVHGGGFDELNTEAIQLANAPWPELQDRGYAIAAVRYRQKPSAVFGADMARDAGYVVQLLRANAAAWNVDPNAIVGYGTSSGAFVLGLLAYGPDLVNPASADPVERASSRLNAFLNDRCESDWRNFVDAGITVHPFASPTLVGVPQQDRERASALWWLEQPGAHAVPTLSFYKVPVNTPPLVNLHDGWLGWQLTQDLAALGETHSAFLLYLGASPLPWPLAYDFLETVVGW
ncbi:MAG: alpha/beta hydrolase [Planctomycetes bacterium]|nr:alpha/beta hydrolase [Planctomycetota bacterium]